MLSPVLIISVIVHWLARMSMEMIVQILYLLLLSVDVMNDVHCLVEKLPLLLYKIMQLLLLEKLLSLGHIRALFQGVTMGVLLVHSRAVGVGVMLVGVVLVVIMVVAVVVLEIMASHKVV